MSTQNNRDEFVSKLSIFGLVSFLFSAYISWSDNQLYSILKDPNLVENLGIFSKLFATIGGGISGMVIGTAAYLIKSILTKVSDEWQYVVIGWGLVLMGLIGGAGAGARQVLFWMI